MYSPPTTVTRVSTFMYTFFICRENRLTWHSGLIPPNEIWVKIGGDKGGGSMKTSFQICNVPHPNSCKNSCVFSIYEAADTTTNLNIALEPFKAQISSLSGKTVWRLVYSHFTHEVAYNIHVSTHTPGTRKLECSCAVTMHTFASCMDCLVHQVNT